MEIALDAAMATYAGRLGLLAGDTIRCATELSLSMVPVTQQGNGHANFG